MRIIFTTRLLAFHDDCKKQKYGLSAFSSSCTNLYDFFGLYLLLYRLNKLFYCVTLVFSFRFKYLILILRRSVLVFSAFPSNFHFLQSLYVQCNRIQPCVSLFLFFYSFALCVFVQRFLPHFYPILLYIQCPSLSAISHILSRIYYAKNRITMPQ